MRHLPGEQFHASHRIAENDDLLRGTGENYWGVLYPKGSMVLVYMLTFGVY